MESPWGALHVSDAHVHFFSYRFFSALADQKKAQIATLPALLGGWDLPEESPEHLAAAWVQELDRYGVEKAALIASIPGDAESVVAAVRKFPQRFLGFAMVDPTAADAPAKTAQTLATGQIHCLCFFPAMHRYSMHDDRVTALLDVAAAHPRVAAFVHCGALSVGVRKKLGLTSHFDLRYSNPIDLHEVALRYPTLRFIVPHFGAGFLREALMICDLCPNVYLDTSSSNSWVRYEEAHLDLRTVFRRALDVAGPRRLLFGTDSSYFPRGWHAQIFETQSKALYEIGVDAEAAQLIFHHNLAQLFS
ncbi:MAG TPA: amidohydrolase family protein [Bryobacteraceae bacterium]|nr:amidohydrolase family protein [Bryobacteraceae bacterium]